MANTVPLQAICVLLKLGQLIADGLYPYGSNTNQQQAYPVPGQVGEYGPASYPYTPMKIESHEAEQSSKQPYHDAGQLGGYDPNMHTANSLVQPIHPFVPNPPFYGPFPYSFVPPLYPYYLAPYHEGAIGVFDQPHSSSTREEAPIMNNSSFQASLSKIQELLASGKKIRFKVPDDSGVYTMFGGLSDKPCYESWDCFKECRELPLHLEDSMGDLDAKMDFIAEASCEYKMCACTVMRGDIHRCYKPCRPCRNHNGKCYSVNLCECEHRAKPKARYEARTPKKSYNSKRRKDYDYD